VRGHPQGSAGRIEQLWICEQALEEQAPAREDVEAACSRRSFDGSFAEDSRAWMPVPGNLPGSVAFGPVQGQGFSSARQRPSDRGGAVGCRQGPRPSRSDLAQLCEQAHRFPCSGHSERSAWPAQGLRKIWIVAAEKRLLDPTEGTGLLWVDPPYRQCVAFAVRRLYNGQARTS